LLEGSRSDQLETKEIAMKKSPCEGGCWFCHDDAGDMLFSTEFDTYVHAECLKNGDRDNPEVRIMSAELLS
jgi:hypothetical protein